MSNLVRNASEDYFPSEVAHLMSDFTKLLQSHRKKIQEQNCPQTTKQIEELRIILLIINELHYKKKFALHAGTLTTTLYMYLMLDKRILHESDTLLTELSLQNLGPNAPVICPSLPQLPSPHPPGKGGG